MRNVFYLAAATLLFAAVPASDADAKPGAAKSRKFRKGSVAKLHGKKGKKKKKKGKKGKKGGQGGSGGDSGSSSSGGGGDTCELPPDVTGLVKGVGRRLSFDFGGKVWVRNGEPSGAFFLAFSPAVPGTVFNITCHYNDFENVEITAARSEFRASGRCRQVEIDGRSTAFNATHDIEINNLETDTIRVTRVSELGPQIPNGVMSFGNFAMNDGSAGAS